jgi:hypothetical protein
VPINRSIWNQLFSQEQFPKLPCPNCPNGRLILDKASFSLTEPEYSKADRKDEDWEFDWVAQRFSARLACEEANCKEVVSMAGDTVHVEDYIEEAGIYEGPGIVEVLRPRSVFPGSPLFPITKSIPDNVARELKLAFQLYWTDTSACVSRLRTSIELMLDQQKVPRSFLTAKKKVARMDLHSRIAAFEKMATGADAATSLQALRNVGNLGTHCGEIADEDLFDAIDVYEDVLLGVYEKKSILAKAKKLGGLK